jgi:hypothetical protein
MKILEIIHLRLAGRVPDDLIDVIRDSVGSAPDVSAVRIYRHLKLENDLAIHLHQDAGSDKVASDVGVRLTAVLKEVGMVSHAVWSERFSMENGPGPTEGS